MRLKVSELTKKYADLTVIDNLSFETSDTGFYAITGESGIGKTTLIRLILGLEKPTSGEIKYLDGDVDKPLKSIRFSGAFQENRLSEDFTAFENIKMVNKDIDETTAKNEFSKLLPVDAFNKKVKELSGGMQRRLCIIMSILHNADLYFFDEPFAGLDDENIEKVKKYLYESLKDKLVFISVHSAKKLDFCTKIF